jgi:hypothetical protein
MHSYISVHGVVRAASYASSHNYPASAAPTSMLKVKFLFYIQV